MEKMKSTCFVIFVIVLAVLLGACGVEQQGSDSLEGFQWGHSMLLADGVLYLINGSELELYDAASGEQKGSLELPESARQIYIGGERLWFIAGNNGGVIHSMSLDGSGLESLNVTNVAYSMFMMEDRLYFIPQDGGLYSCDMQGGEVTEHITDVPAYAREMCIGGDRIFFISSADGALYGAAFDGSERFMLRQQGGVMPASDGQRLCLLNEGECLMLPCSGGEAELLCSGVSTVWGMSACHLYLSYTETPGLFAVDIENGETERLLEETPLIAELCGGVIRYLGTDSGLLWLD